VKNLTFSADEDLIDKARSIARARRTTLNAAFREWLTQYAASEGDAHSFDALMKDLWHVDAGGHHTREQFRER
jgi:hypothetical protein